MIPHSLRSLGETHIVPRGGRAPARPVQYAVGMAAALAVLLGATSVLAQPHRLAPLTAVNLDARAASVVPLATPGANPASGSDAASSDSTVVEPSGQEPTMDADAPAATAAAGEVIEYYALDAVGSVRVVFDPAGTVVARADYMPFGETLEQTAGLPAERFTGQERDPEVGQDYFNARYYAARLGRFTSVDPVFSGAVADPQQWNRYAYARNSPLVFTDPTGLDPCVGHPPTTTSGGVTCATNQPGGGSPWPGGGYPGYSDWMCHSFGLCHLFDPPPYAPYQPPPSDAAPPPTGTPNPPPNKPNPTPDPPTNPELPAPPEPSELPVLKAGFNPLILPAILNVVRLGWRPLAARLGLAAAASAPLTVTFGHGARHLSSTGLSAAQIEGAIAQRLATISQTAMVGSHWGWIRIGSQYVEYRAHLLPNGVINVGTYYIPRQPPTWIHP